MSSSLRALLEQLAGRTFVTEDGDEHAVRLLPPAAPEHLAQVEWQSGVRLPAELRGALKLARGFETDLIDPVDLANVERCAYDGLFGWMLSLTGDGAGNYWVVELRERMPVLGPVWHLCHDPFAVVYQSPDLATFLADFARYETTHDGPVADVVNDALTRVTEVQHPERSTLVDSPDEVLREFARSLTGEWFVADLRDARPGDGMPLGRYGPKTPLARAGEAFVFAYASRTRWQRFKSFVTGK